MQKYVLEPKFTYEYLMIANEIMLVVHMLTA